MPLLESGIFYQMEGAGDVPLVLIHGVGSNLHSWDGVVRGSRDRFKILRYDLRGHGRSVKPREAFALSDYVEDLRALMESSGYAKANVAGFSLGGITAQAFAIAYPDKIERLALISTASGRTEAERQRVEARAQKLAAEGAHSHGRDAADRWFTQAFQKSHPEIVQQTLRDIAKNDPFCYAVAYRILADNDLIGALSKIRAPTLVITGEDDLASTPRMAKLMAEAIPQTDLHILAGLKHMLPAQAPEALSAHLRDFLCPCAAR